MVLTSVAVCWISTVWSAGTLDSRNFRSPTRLASPDPVQGIHVSTPLAKPAPPDMYSEPVASLIFRLDVVARPAVQTQVPLRSGASWAALIPDASKRTIRARRACMGPPSCGALQPILTRDAPLHPFAFRGSALDRQDLLHGAMGLIDGRVGVGVGGGVRVGDGDPAEGLAGRPRTASRRRRARTGRRASCTGRRSRAASG